jgi:hypothetical protein
MSNVHTPSLNTAVTSLRSQALSYDGDRCVTYKAGVFYESDSRCKWLFVNGLSRDGIFELLLNGTCVSVLGDCVEK